jgi:ribosomal protein S27AE
MSREVERSEKGARWLLLVLGFITLGFGIFFFILLLALIKSLLPASLVGGPIIAVGIAVLYSSTANLRRGSKARVVKDSRYCPRCGHTMAADLTSRFCRRCGYSLEAGE